MMKAAVVVIILLAAGTGYYFFLSDQDKVTNNRVTEVVDTAVTTPPATNMPNPASAYCSEHGGQSSIRTAADGSQSGVCVFTDGAECDEWKFFRGECSPPAPTQAAVITPGTQKAVQEFLAQKYNKPLSEVKVTVTKEAPGYAAGSVMFGSGGPGGGGMWLAVAGNRWNVVWDGNGSIDCPGLRQQYGFPDSILRPNFCD